MTATEKIQLVLEAIGALSTLCTVVAAMLPEGKAKHLLTAIGFDLAKLRGRK